MCGWEGGVDTHSSSVILLEEISTVSTEPFTRFSSAVWLVNWPGTNETVSVSLKTELYSLRSCCVGADGSGLVRVIRDVGRVALLSMNFDGGVSCA